MELHPSWSRQQKAKLVLLSLVSWFWSPAAKKWVAELFTLPYLLLHITLSKKWTITIQAGRAISCKLLFKAACWLLVYCWVQCHLLMLFVWRNLERRVFRDSCLFRQRESLQVLGLILCLVEKYPYHFPAAFLLDFFIRFGLSLGANLLSPLHVQKKPGGNKPVFSFKPCPVFQRMLSAWTHNGRVQSMLDGHKAGERGVCCELSKNLTLVVSSHDRWMLQWHQRSATFPRCSKMAMKIPLTSSLNRCRTRTPQQPHELDSRMIASLPIGVQL